MNWAIGQGYLGLYNTTNKRESAKDELNVLQVLDQQMRQDKADKEAAQLKEQAYQDQISKFADQLLAGDRNRINKKAKEMSSMIREHIKMYGGNMQKFFENGGHRIMSEYRNGVINSEEASQYIDNKKNMERILDMQSKGFGHLINPIDMYNLNQYHKNGEGKITFTGALNEIEMLPPESVEWGEEITADKILSYKNNYTKFLGNYKLTYPNAPDPTYEDLKQFVQNSHSDILGTNWQKPLAEKKEAFEQQANVRDYDWRVNSFNAEQKFKRDQAQAEQERWEAEFGLKKDNQLFEQELSMLQLKSDGQGGYTDSSGKQVSSKDADAQYSLLYDLEEANSDLNNSITNVDQINSTVWDKYKHIFGQESLPDYDEAAYDHAQNGSGGVFEGQTWLNKVGRNQHKLRGSKMLLNGQIASNFATESKMFNFDKDGTFLLDLDQNTDLFDSAGNRIRNWSSSSTKAEDGGFLTDQNYASDIKNNKFKVKGVVTGFIGKDKQNNELLLTDIATRGDNGKTVRDKSATDKFYERNVDKKSRPFAKTLVVIEDDNGNRFYKALDGDTEKTAFAKFAASNNGLAKKARDNAYKIQQQKIAQKDQTAIVYKELRSTPGAIGPIRQQVKQITQQPNTMKFDNAAISFYTHLKNNLEQAGVNKSMQDLINEGSFYSMTQEIQSDPNKKKQLDKLLQDPNFRSRDLINFLIKNSNYDRGQDWLNTFEYINKIK